METDDGFDAFLKQKQMVKDRFGQPRLSSNRFMDEYVPTKPNKSALYWVNVQPHDT